MFCYDLKIFNAAAAATADMINHRCKCIDAQNCMKHS